ncbi:hypothetical protein GCM10009706_11390 [Curtobacterium citreum]|nr:hypothetical protein FB462_2373 [Curtobacterium citreum]GGL74617.1 hypothetical protein GCM10009706_11390 [Curtobacterium citreum]
MRLEGRADLGGVRQRVVAPGEDGDVGRVRAVERGPVAGDLGDDVLPPGPPGADARQESDPVGQSVHHRAVLGLRGAHVAVQEHVERVECLDEPAHVRRVLVREHDARRDRGGDGHAGTLTRAQRGGQPVPGPLRGSGGFPQAPTQAHDAGAGNGASAAAVVGQRRRRNLGQSQSAQSVPER